MTKIIHGPITVKKIVKGVWLAECECESPFKSCHISMRGTSEQDALAKLKKWLQYEEQ